MDKAIRKIIEGEHPSFFKYEKYVWVKDSGGWYQTRLVDFTKAIQLLKTPQKISKKRKAILKKQNQSNDTEQPN